MCFIANHLERFYMSDDNESNGDDCDDDGASKQASRKFV